MRAGGLLVGIGLLAACWVAWLVDASDVSAPTASKARTSPLDGPRPAPAAAVASAGLSDGSTAGRVARPAPPGLALLPVTAALDTGAPIADALRAWGREPRLRLLAGDAATLLGAPAAAPALVAAAPAPAAGALDDGSTWIADVAAAGSPAWVALFDGDRLLGTRRIVPGQTLLAFVMSADELRERLGLPPTT